MANKQLYETNLTLPLSLWHKINQYVKEGYAHDTNYFIIMGINMWIDEIIRHKAEEKKQ